MPWNRISPLWHLVSTTAPILAFDAKSVMLIFESTTSRTLVDKAVIPVEEMVIAKEMVWADCTPAVPILALVLAHKNCP